VAWLLESVDRVHTGDGPVRGIRRTEKVGLNTGNTVFIREDQDALCEYRGAGKPSSIEVIHDDGLVYGSLRRPCWVSPSRD
jgi:hypothetical protein